MEQRKNVTSIELFDNKTTYTVPVKNLENSNDNITLAPNTSEMREMWIPWADSAQAFSGHHIEVAVNTTTYCIWQQGDRVRYSTDGQWQSGGTAIPGDSGVGGDRKLLIFPDRIELDAYARKAEAPS